MGIYVLEEERRLTPNEQMGNFILKVCVEEFKKRYSHYSKLVMQITLFSETQEDIAFSFHDLCFSIWQCRLHYETKDIPETTLTLSLFKCYQSYRDFTLKNSF